MIKLMCKGHLPDGQATTWSAYASDVQHRKNGDMAIFVDDRGVMGFRKGGWEKRPNTGDYDIYDVDFSTRFPPRRRKVTP